MRYDRARSVDFNRSMLECLAAGEKLLSLGVRCSRSPDIARMASGAGYDIIWIDLEHSSLSIDTACQIAATAHDLGLAAWVRIPEREYGVIGRVLDSGATGIIAPKIETEAEARLLAAACRFPPVGQRSMIAKIPQTGFVRSPVNEFVKAANQKVVVQVLIESSLGVENIDAIAAVEGVDIIAVGANDLTAEMGCPGQVREPAVIAAFERIAAAANRYGKIAVVGGVPDDEYYLAILEMGFSSFIFAGIDTDILTDGLAQRANAWRQKFA